MSLRLATTILEALSSVGGTTTSQRDWQARQGKGAENGLQPSWEGFGPLCPPSLLHSPRGPFR